MKAQVEELSRKNQQLEAQLPRAEEVGESSNERLNVRVTHVPESTSEQHIIDLQVTLRGERPVVDMVIRILEFLKQVNNVTVMSMEASTHVAESTSFSRVILRLNIEVCIDPDACNTYCIFQHTQFLNTIRTIRFFIFEVTIIFTSSLLIYTYYMLDEFLSGTPHVVC